MRLVRRLPLVARLAEARGLRAQNLHLAKLILEQSAEITKLREQVLWPQASGNGSSPKIHDSIDVEPWRHPYLTAAHLSAFRRYSEQVWQFALDYQGAHPRPLRAAFTVNMCQNMYKWARLARERGHDAVLFPHVMDATALSRPEWEEFDGGYDDVFDGEGFLHAHPELKPAVPCEYVPISSEGADLLTAWLKFRGGESNEFGRLQAAFPGIRYETLMSYAGFYTYCAWAERLATFDVIYGCSNPFAAYASGRPYLVQSVGGDVIFDCGKGDDYGRAHLAAFNAARFQSVSNPHTLAHCRRLGLVNPVYMPYPMDDRKYAPAPGRARREWVERFGDGIYVFTPSRIDSAWKGFDAAVLEQLRQVAAAHPEVRFVFLGWGENQQSVRDWIASAGLSRQVIVLSPVGKVRLIDYYRSCDIVLDQLSWGYYGVTLLEAAAIAKPVVTKLRVEHYKPLYGGDAAPVNDVGPKNNLKAALTSLIAKPSYRQSQGEAMRAWLLRNHGEDRTMAILLALMRLAADEVALPPDLVSPLTAELSAAERAYHQSCVRLRPPSP